MGDNLKKSQNKSKLYSIFIKTLVVVIGIFLIYTFGVLIYASLQDKDSFEVNEYQDEFDDTNCELLINGIKIDGYIDLNKYQTYVDTGKYNYKMSFIINSIVKLVKLVLLIPIMLTISKMLDEISNEFRPFTLKNVKRLRNISILIIALTCAPALLELLINFFIFLQSSVVFGPINFMMILLGIAFRGISYIFAFGCALQDDVDTML